ncbi:MAG: hypothetical protein ABFS38_20010 [Bacteroidota bacterium]
MDSIERIPPEKVERLKQQIFAKIPELSGGWEQVYVSRADLKRLTDEEFLILWMLPGIDVRVGNKTAEYVNERRQLLGLTQGKHSNIKKEAPPPRKPYRDEWDELFDS